MSRAPRRGAEPGEGPGCPAHTGGRCSRGSVFLRLEKLDELPVLVALRAHWWQGSPRGPSQCPSSAGRALRPSGPGPSEERPPPRPLQPSLSSCRPRFWPLGGCLAARSPPFWPTPAPPADSSPSRRSPRSSAKPQAQAAGPGEADQAPFPRPPPSRRPSSGWSENSRLGAWASSQAALQSWPRDTHARDDVITYAASQVLLGGPGQRARARVDPV